MDPKALRELFHAESEELLSDLEHGLMVLENDRNDDEAINQIFRAAHTIKSNAGMVGFDAIVAFAHVAEDVLSRVRARELMMADDLASLFLDAVDVLRSMLQEAAEGKSVSLDQKGRTTLELLENYVKEPSTIAIDRPPVPQTLPGGLRIFQIDLEFQPGLFTSGQEPAYLIDELYELGDVLDISASADALPSFPVMAPEHCYLKWQLLLRTERTRRDIEAVFLFVADRNSIGIADVTQSNPHLVELAQRKLGELLIDEGCVKASDIATALSQQKRIGDVLIDLGKVERETVDRTLHKQEAARLIRQNSTIRVDTGKLDKLVNLVGEMTIAISQVNQVTRDPASTLAARIAAVETLEQIGRDLQTQVMSVRMAAIQETFARFKRMVRDLAKELGKHVVLETFGNETELDKLVGERLADPLKHMIRNAVAHGLETPEERILAGKSDTGRIQLKAAQRHGYIVVEVIDDGRGIDVNLIRGKALRLGMVSEREHLTERQLFDLLFRPGFSTAAEISEVSGRGVGLDVVKRNVLDLHGTVEVESVLGRGTTFRIKLPLTLAIIEGMNVRVGRETLTIPIASVVELVTARAGQLATVERQGELVDLRGEYVPMVRLGDVLGRDRSERAALDPIIVIVESSGRKFGVMVDKVLGMDQMVVKPLLNAFSLIKSIDRSYRKPDAISGSTILGDGNVALILDVPGLERMAFGDTP